MQVPSKSDLAGLLDRLVARELQSGSTLEAWDSFLRAHAILMSRLEVDLAQATGLALADFDVLAQLARAGGELRMTDLATPGARFPVRHDPACRPAGRGRPRPA